MMLRAIRNHRGDGKLQFVVILSILVALSYVGVKMGKPYFAYRSLERTMEQWAKITLYRGDRNYADLIEKIKWTIDRHNIPLTIEDVQIEYDPEERVLSVYAEYDFYVEFPGYVHHYFFQPYAEVQAEEN